MWYPELAPVGIAAEYQLRFYVIGIRNTCQTPGKLNKSRILQAPASIKDIAGQHYNIWIFAAQYISQILKAHGVLLQRCL